MGPPLSPVCPQTPVFRDGGAALTLSGGGLLTGNVAFGNPRTIYATYNGSGCGWAMQMEFSPPAANPTFTLMVPSFWRDRFRITAFSSSGALHTQVVELRGSSRRVTVPAAEVLWVTIEPLNQLGLIGVFYAIDDVSFEYVHANRWDSLDFAVNAGTAEQQRRVLIHKYRSDDAYPSPWQQQDGTIEISGTARTTFSVPVPGATVYFRLIDPPDTAPYIPAAERRSGDNEDGPGTLSAASAVADAMGRARVKLTVTDRYAGDNYVVEASPDPQFSCSPNCSRSGVLTAWKRVYVEVHKMFRKGAYLAEDVEPGATEIRVRDVRGFPNPPFKVRLMHGHELTNSARDVLAFYSEEVEVLSKTPLPREPDGTAPGILHLRTENGAGTAVVSRQYVFEQKADGIVRPYLADAVGLLSGSRRRDFLVADGTLVNDLFAEAFTEHVWLTDAQPGVDADLRESQPRIGFDAAIPYDPMIGANDQHQREWTARKWMQHARGSGRDPQAFENHQVLLAASRHAPLDPHNPGAYQLGLATVADGFNDSWVFVDRMNRRTGREAVVHELAHQWLVNSTPRDAGGHCNLALGRDQVMARDRSRTCTMTSHLYPSREAEDGVVGFHYVTFPAGAPPDSEYLWIRRRSDPVPQHERTGRNPQ